VERLSGPLRARDDVTRIALLGYGAEVCASLAPEGAPAEKLHGLLGAWLDVLEADGPPGPALRHALEAKALTFAGLAPALLVCARCGEPLEDPVVFEAEAGGGRHARCGTGTPVRSSGLAELDRLRRTPLAELATAQAPHVPVWLLSAFVVWQLGRPLRSRALLEALG
jgi:DNA repair protein RecO (recombination protein O)